MIPDEADVVIERIPLSKVRVAQVERRDLTRVAHYLSILAEHPTWHLGILITEAAFDGYELQDGHHRFLAYLIAGREYALAAVIC